MPLKVYYKGIVEVGNFVPDLYVDDMMVLELKAVKDIEPAHIAQLINYLTTTNSKVGYVLNFGRHRYFHPSVPWSIGFSRQVLNCAAILHDKRL